MLICSYGYVVQIRRLTRTVSLKQLSPNESYAPGILRMPGFETLRYSCLKLFVYEAIIPRHGGLDPNKRLRLGQREILHSE